MHPAVQAQLPAILKLCRKHRVRRVALFGSALRDDFDPERSDIDLLVDFEEMAPADHADAFLDLIVELEQLLQRPVDVIERRAIRNPYFRRAVESENQVLYDAA